MISPWGMRGKGIWSDDRSLVPVVPSRAMGRLEFKTARQAETEAVPIRYVAEMLGADADSEWAIRWLIALMVLCCDPLAIAGDPTRTDVSMRTSRHEGLSCRDSSFSRPAE
jgi:hypothetical protein